MKALNTLIRIRKQALDRSRRQLAALESERAEITAAIAQMIAALDIEQQVAGAADELLVFYPGFAEGTRGRREALEAQAAKLDQDIDEAREVVRVALADLKKFEIALAARERRARAAAERRERITLDELAIDMHRRQKLAS